MQELNMVEVELVGGGLALTSVCNNYSSCLSLAVNAYAIVKAGISYAGSLNQGGDFSDTDAMGNYTGGGGGGPTTWAANRLR
jgi:hypothetical protein